MKKARSGFATVLFLTALMPLSLLMFNVWQRASLYHELMMERQSFYQETSYLEEVLGIMVQHLKKQHVVIWENIERLKQSLVLPCSLVVGNKIDDKQINFHAILDKPADLDPFQVRICIQLLKNDMSVKRSIACLLTRQIKTTEKKEHYVFVVDYFTLSATI